jgi:hypothetical protein
VPSLVPDDDDNNDNAVQPVNATQSQMPQNQVNPLAAQAYALAAVVPRPPAHLQAAPGSIHYWAAPR